MMEQTVETTALNPRSTHAMADADCIGRSGTPGHGPYMVIYLKLDGGRIGEATCQTYGCPTAIACGSKLTEWVRGKTPAAVSRISPDQIRSWFKKFPLGKRHCADIAAAALRDAAANCGTAGQSGTEGQA